MNIRDLFEKYGIKPKKSLGQNFLTDGNALNKIIKEADIKKSDVVLEIGPGLGILTKELSKKAKKVIAVEKDDNLFKVLKQELKDHSNVEVVNRDILGYDPRLKEYKVIANLPFNIASAVIRKFLEAKNPPEEMILMVQKEVAQRITAEPPDMTVLSLSVQLYAEPKTLFFISRNSFLPHPKVDAAVLRIATKSNIALMQNNAKIFFKIAKAGFSSPRKQLANNLSSGLKEEKEKVIKWLIENNIEPTRRAETLTVQEWMSLARNILD